jgi:ribosomal protein S27AE
MVRKMTKATFLRRGKPVTITVRKIKRRGKWLSLRNWCYVQYTRALRHGKLTRGEKCDECGYKYGILGHHNDYSRPLNVSWLCGKCHNHWHFQD